MAVVYTKYFTIRGCMVEHRWQLLVVIGLLFYLFFMPVLSLDMCSGILLLVLYIVLLFINVSLVNGTGV